MPTASHLPEQPVQHGCSLHCSLLLATPGAGAVLLLLLGGALGWEVELEVETKVLGTLLLVLLTAAQVAAAGRAQASPHTPACVVLCDITCWPPSDRMHRLVSSPEIKSRHGRRSCTAHAGQAAAAVQVRLRRPARMHIPIATCSSSQAAPPTCYCSPTTRRQQAAALAPSSSCPCGRQRQCQARPGSSSGKPIAKQAPVPRHRAPAKHAVWPAAVGRAAAGAGLTCI